MLQLPALSGLEAVSGGAAVYGDDEQPEVFYVVPGVARIRRATDGTPMLALVKYRSRPAGMDQASGGGFLDVQTELVLDEQRSAAISAELQRRAGRPVVLTQPIFVSGRVQLITMSPRSGGMVEAVVGSVQPSLQHGLTASFTLKLSRDGAALMWDQLRADPAPVAVRYELEMLARFPPATVHAFSRGGVASVEIVDWPTADPGMARLRDDLASWAQGLLTGAPDQDIVFTRRSAVVWPVHPQSTLQGLAGETRGFVEADLTDPFFATLQVDIRVNAELAADRIRAITVRLSYAAHRHDAVFTDSATTDRFQAVVEPALGRRYRYQVQVHFAGTAATLLLPEAESDSAHLLVSLDDVGWLRREVVADNVDWESVASVQVALRYADPAAGVPDQTDVVALDRLTPHRDYERAVYAVVDKALQHQVTYVLQSGRSVVRDWADHAGRLLVVPDVFDRSMVVRFVATSGFVDAVSHVVECKRTVADGQHTQRTAVLAAGSPSAVCTFGLFEGEQESFSYRVTTTRSDATSDIGQWIDGSGSCTVPVGPLPGAQLTVEASADLVDLDRVKVIALTLTPTRAGAGRLVFAAGRAVTQTWQTHLAHGEPAQYTWTVDYHLGDGTRRQLAGGPTGDPSIVIPPAPS